MSRLLVTAFVSLDGVVQGPGGPDEDTDGGFTHGGWAVPFIGPEVIARVTEVTARADGLVLGRRTYEGFAATWPLAADDDPVGAKLNTVPKYVASRSLTEVTWTGATLLEGDVADAVRALKADGAGAADGDRGDEGGGGELQVHGSGNLVQTLLAHDLVDDLHLVVVPVLVGSGKRLFGSGTAPATFSLVDTTATATGAVVTTYRRAGALSYGAMGPETGNW